MDVSYIGEGIISGYLGSTKFRPSAWSEMLCDCAATFHQLTKTLEYADFLRPMYSDEHGHCVRANFDEMRKVHPLAYEHVQEFIKSNHLHVFALDGHEIEPVLDPHTHVEAA